MLLGLALSQPRRVRPLASTVPTPASAIEIPPLPVPHAPAANASAITAVAVVPLRDTVGWMAQRFPDSQILEQRQTPPAPDGAFQCEYLLDTQLKCAAVAVRETWELSPFPVAVETLVKREAWVADHFLLKPRPGLNLAALEAAVAQGGGSLDQITLARNGLLIVRLPQSNLGAVMPPSLRSRRRMAPRFTPSPIFFASPPPSRTTLPFRSSGGSITLVTPATSARSPAGTFARQRPGC